MKGQVVDSTGEPVIGANIVVKGTNTGVISDIDGNFAIDAPKNSVLLISFIGYKSQEVKVTVDAILLFGGKDTTFPCNFQGFGGKCRDEEKEKIGDSRN